MVNLTSGIILKIFIGYESTSKDIAVTQDLKLLILGSTTDDTIKIWSITSKKISKILIDKNNNCTCMNLSNSEKFLISGYINTLNVLWNIINRK